MPHLLDVARIAWILNLERGCGLHRDVVYAAALLHDIGRAAQYQTGEPHDEAGTRIAAEVLDALPEPLRFDGTDRTAILHAVEGHRGPLAGREGGAHGGSAAADVLAHLIKEADGRSRACFACAARDACYWSEERKNLSIDI
ncbi:Ribonuclease Y [Collinsella intestinalis]|nr:Ribonuclease Y [Collinsella intestinalis]